MLPESSIAHYRIASKIGAGGMGEVYRATDTKLGRDVALKVLPADMARDPERLARFRREARAVAMLNHPHIVTIYSVEEADGVHFLTMELIEGQSLDRQIPAAGMPVERIVEIGSALAEALATAHEKGIVHRDLKPANVMLTAEGRVKVLDFGLAKDLRTSQPVDATMSAGHTQLGVVMGTPAYMSPEQIAGRPLDHRTDIFSLGILLYEMLSGQRPFQGASSAELASAILRDTPRPLSEIRSGVAPDLCRLIQRCLEKDAAARYSSARDVRDALQTLRRELDSNISAVRSPGSGSRQVASAPGPSIAVLPFVNMSGDADNEYFSDGLSEDLINALSRLPGLQVAARTSAFRFRGSDLDVRQIGRQLDVATVVEGSVRRAGSRLRVTAQLVNVENGYQLWSQRYDRQMADVFEIQDEIVTAIVEAVVPALLGDAGNAIERPTENTEAYELYLKGRHYWHQRSPSTLRLAIQSFEQAIQIDPQYALAYAGLSDSYGILRVYGWVSAEEGRPKAHAAMTKAMTLAPSTWEANFSQGFYWFYFERNWREADPHFQKALAINPRSSLAQAYYGIFLSLCGQAGEAIAHAALACQLDPVSPYIHGAEGMVHNALGRFEEAERSAQRALELQPDYLFGLWQRGLALAGLDRHQDAIETLERVITLSRAPMFAGILGLAYARAGRRDDAKRLLHELDDRGSRGEYIPAFAPLTILAGLGDLPAIRQALAATVAETTAPLSLRATGGHFLEAFRSDPEIDRLLFELYGR